MDYLGVQNIQVKGVLLGETLVGKTSLSNRFYSKRWDPITSTTISATCQKTDMNIDGNNFTFCVWDTAGQERFRSISPIYYRGSHVAIIVFDLTNKQSFEMVKSWVKELRSQGPIGIPIVILANKHDLKDKEELYPDQETLIKYKNSIGADCFYVSALSGENVDEAFTLSAKLGLQFYREQQAVSLPQSAQTNLVKAQNQDSAPQNGPCC